MQMRPKIVLSSKFNFAVLRMSDDAEKLEVIKYFENGLDAVCAAFVSLKGESVKLIIAERGAFPVMVLNGKIVDYFFREWVVIWK